MSAIECHLIALPSKSYKTKALSGAQMQFFSGVCAHKGPIFFTRDRLRGSCKLHNYYYDLIE